MSAPQQPPSRRIVSLSDVATAARETLQQHLPQHLAALPRPLPPPGNYKQAPSSEHVRKVRGSTVAVLCSGLAETPTRRGDGAYDMTAVVSVAVFHEDTEQTPLLTAAGDYLAAIAECLDQHPQLGGLARSTELDTLLVDLYEDQHSNRLLGYGIAEFRVRIRRALTAVPPPEPDQPAGGPPVTATTSSVTIRTRSER